MTVLAHTLRKAAALLAAACSAVAASAQVTTTPAYVAPQSTPVAAYAASPASGYAQHPMHSGVTNQPAYGGQPAYGQPAYGQPTQGFAAPSQTVQQAQPTTQAAYGQPAYQQPAYTPPAYATPRLADASQSTTPIIAPTQAIPAANHSPPAAMAVGHSAPAVQSHPSVSWEGYAGVSTNAGCAVPACGDAGCGVGGCGVGGCDLGSCYPNKRKRQWFGGLYYILLDRVDTGRKQVAYLTDTAGFTPGDDYYYQPTDVGLFTDDANLDVMHGAEIRFGSTFGPSDPCTCQPRFAWEVAYWGLDTSEAEAFLILDGAVSSTFTNRIYGTLEKAGLQYDIGAGNQPANELHDQGVPADGDVFANDVRILGTRVRRRFTAQNLELNFWRFGNPECGSACGGGGLGGVLQGGGAACGDSCGVGACGIASCGSSRPPRRFFINGLLGVRYFRVDDDLGIDTQFTLVDGVGDPQTGFGDTYTGFGDSIGTIIEGYEVDNQLVGFQLGCSMNWLIGCKWNLFADSNFGIYGNNAEVAKGIFIGGGGVASYEEGGGSFSFVRESETNVAFLGELRTGVAYQVTNNCRLSAAYRFIGAGGMALAESQIPQNFSNSSLVSQVNADDSLILHGLQLGAEYQY